MTRRISSAAKASLRHPAGWVATGFGSGLSPKAPGTAGSLAALLPWMVFRDLPLWGHGLLLLLAFALGVWACQWAITQSGEDDPGWVVWDEFVGLWIALLALPDSPWFILLAFGLFRLFDILKPWPVSWADRRIAGGLGTMLDDVFAGLYALLGVQGLVLLLKQF